MTTLESLEARWLLDSAVGLSWASNPDWTAAATVPGALVRLPLRAEVRNEGSEGRLSVRVRFMARPQAPATGPDVPLTGSLVVRSLAPATARQVGVAGVRLPPDLRPGTYRLVAVAEPATANTTGAPPAELVSPVAFTVSYTISSATPNLTFRLGDALTRVTFRGPGRAVFEPQALTDNFDLVVRETSLQTRIAVTVASTAPQLRNINANVPVGVLDLRRASFSGSLTLAGGQQIFLPNLTSPATQSVVLGGSYQNLTLGHVVKVNIIASAPIEQLRIGNATELSFLSTRPVGRIVAGELQASNIRLVGNGENATLGRFTSRLFSNTRVFAQQLGGASLGRVVFATVGRDYGVVYDAGGRVSGRGLRPYQVVPGVEPFRRDDFVIGNRATFNWGLGG